jgi:hypothetical protein
MQASLLLTLLTLVYPLEDYIRVFRLIDCYHLQVEIVIRTSHHSRERLLTNLTLEFSEIV